MSKTSYIAIFPVICFIFMGCLGSDREVLPMDLKDPTIATTKPTSSSTMTSYTIPTTTYDWGTTSTSARETTSTNIIERTTSTTTYKSTTTTNPFDKLFERNREKQKTTTTSSTTSSTSTYPTTTIIEGITDAYDNKYVMGDRAWGGKVDDRIY